MTTIIRVKRHFQDDPVEALRLQCKRRRTEEAGDSPSFEKVLSFVGTVDKKDDCIAQRTLAISSAFQKRAKEKQGLKNYKTNVLDKMRKENKIRSEANRFKVISFMRSTQDGAEIDVKANGKSNDLAIVDVSMEKQQFGELSTVKEEGSSEEAFVYDIYSASFENEDFNDIYLDNVIGIEPYTSHTVFNMEYRNTEDYAAEDFEPDEDDSNDENNWRNDYPDEEGSESEEIDVLTCEFDKFGRGEACELSSDDDEDKYANYSDRDERYEYYCYDEDDDDVRGSRYEKYKRKIMENFGDSESFYGDGEEAEETF